MTKSWGSSNIPITSSPKNNTTPYLSRGVLYPSQGDDNEFFLFGGTVPSDNNSFVGQQDPQPEGDALWSYAGVDAGWRSYNTGPDIVRPCSGQSAVLEEKGLAYYFNGEQDNGSSITAEGLGATTKFLDGMLVIDLNTRTVKNFSTAGVDSQARVRGGMVHVPLPGSDGILALLAGGEKPADNLEHDWKGEFFR
jgi:hypothetical protein